MTDEVEIRRRLDAVTHYLTSHFGNIGASTLRAIHERVEWLELDAGDTLMRQGEEGEAAYLTLSGRLRVYVADETGANRMVRELGRGQITGEMSLYTGEPRSATVIAVRHTLLARMDQTHFQELIARNPQVSVALTNMIIRRLQTQNRPASPPAPVMLTLLPITDGVGLEGFARQLKRALSVHGNVCLVNRSGFESAGSLSSSDASSRLDELEAAHDFVLMLAEPSDQEWVQTCVAHSDEVLLLADASQAPDLHPVETALLQHRGEVTEVAETLVLLHDRDRKHPSGVRKWLDRRRLTGHVNLRPWLEADMARLARLLSRNAVGLVLAGGGARGFAHLGIWKVLSEEGVEIDWVGGTSMGAVMAAAIASDQGIDQTLDVVRQAFRVNPTGDYNLIPLISLIRGERVRRIIQDSFEKLAGDSADIVDLWKGFFCMASNYSQGSEVRFEKGDLARSLRASIAIPGALPPVVHEGELLCDGGTFNNFPVNVMRQMRGVGKVMGVDLGARALRRLTIQETPSPWALFWDRFRPRSRRRYRFPSLLSYLLNVSILYSISRQSESKRLTDLYFNPPLLKVGLLQWRRFDSIVKQGEAHARDVLNGLTEEQRRRWGLREGE